ncbi:MAG: hypothetical protein KHY27_05570 [Butyricicoccus pullicaecorum]|nr:hypothetical protein [Butyricicoccus pullicaecorum]
MSDNRNFDDVIRGLENAEQDVDKVLKAARLERHESSRLTAQQKMSIITLVLAGVFCMLIVLMMFAFPIALELLSRL